MIHRITARLTGAVQAAVKSHLAWVHRVTSSHPLRVVLVSLFLMAAACGSIATIRFESDIFTLFPARQGALRLFIDSLRWSGGAKEAYFLLEGERDSLATEAEAFAGRLKALRVDGAPAFTKVTYRVYDPAEAGPFADFIGYATLHPQLFLPPEDTDAYAARLTPEAMERSLRRARTELAGSLGGVARDLVARDPLYLRDLILPRLKQGSQALDLDPASPYFLSRDGRLLIMIAETARPVQEMAFARKLAAGIEEARRGAKVRISCTGAHLAAVMDERVMKREIVACILSSLVVVLLLFYLTYRRFLPTLLIPLILCAGVVLALGTAGLFLPSISIISFAFMALIIGLGTDYSIHLYDRYHSERWGGKDSGEALRLAVVDTGHGVFTAAATTAFPFLALTISDVRALSELGLLVGLGVIFSLYATLFFLPPLLIYTEHRFPGKACQPLPGFGLGRLWDLTGRHRKALSYAALSLIILLGVAACFVSFEGELKNLQPRHSEAFVTQEKIERHLSLAPKQMLVALEGDDLADLFDRAGKVELLAERYRQKGEIRAFSSLGQLVNARDRQAEVSARLARAIPAADPGTSLRTALVRNGFAPEGFGPAIAGLSLLKREGPLPAATAVERLGNSPLRGVVERHLVRDDQGHSRLLIYLHYPAQGFNQGAFLGELHAIDPTAGATSVDLVSAQLAAEVKKSFALGFALGGALVLFLLVAHFESLAGVTASLFPVGAGICAMLGIMALTRTPINFMNAMVLVTIIGMGSDYGLHVHHRTVGVSGTEQRAAFVQAGRSVLLSALTTIAGFGSLAFTDYGAMSSIGWATNYGIGATALFALVVLPAFRRI